MPLSPARRKLLALEAHLWHHIDACKDRAIDQLTTAELEHLQCLYRTHGVEADRIDLRDIPYHAAPAWATDEQWAAMQRYAHLFLDAYRDHRAQRKGNVYANDEATHSSA